MKIASIRIMPRNNTEVAALADNPISPEDWVWCFTDDQRMYLAIFKGVKRCDDPGHIHAVCYTPPGYGPFARN